ncbi:organic solute transporter Ostalpha-domain-containing protein [Cristinia sonorae]|uniref:Organic solute transporter Ostalpha-domain-containing protein n=1 Tax=Cristinia sonorae TaxID=1940300 RepID=A0A8K0UUT2_9AGAR|nr:organic solute transporter Ostalpha-domain-containing protein [Cristinia sonorae]
MSCPSENAQVIDQSSFWGPDGIDWDAHKIGWVVSGACAAATVAISLVSIIMHCVNYHNPGEQRQVLRILYMPPIYAVISFFSYRFFRSYTYYELIETAYESITLSAFMLLLIQYVAATATHHDVHNAIARKDKSALPLPFCCWRYRPTKAYFMYTVKWSVLQYVIIRPTLSIVGIICQRKGILCESGAWSFRTAKAYITVIDGISITIALYGLVVFYGLTKDELKGRRPLAKFLAIKLIVMVTFYQSLVFGALEGRVIHATEFWTTTNISDGLNALCITVEMVIFSAFMMWAYTWKEYTLEKRPRTGVLRPLWDSINYSDFVMEIWGSLVFFWRYIRGHPQAHGPRITVTDNDGKARNKVDFGEAFGVEGSSPRLRRPSAGIPDSSSESDLINSRTRTRESRVYEEREDIRLAPYAASAGQQQQQMNMGYAYGDGGQGQGWGRPGERRDEFRGQHPPAAVIHGEAL